MLHNPPQLYTAGNVRLNSDHYANVAMQYQAHKQAKDEALDKYFGNLPNTINEQGVRDVDIPVLHQQKDAIQQYYMQNRDNIKKGNTPEAFNIGKMFREAQGTVTESKNRTKVADNIGKLRGNPKYDYIFRDPTIIDKIGSHDLPVNDPNSKGIDFNQLTLPPAPFDAAKYINGFKVKPNPTTPEYKNIPGDKFNRLEITGKQFSPEDLNAIHMQATTQLYNDPSFENQIKEHVQKDPAVAAKMAEVFQKHYGHSIENEGDLATAYTLSLMDLTPTQKTVKNQNAYNAEWDRRHAISFKDSMAKIAANKKEGTSAESLGYLSDEVASEVGKVLDVRMKDSQNPEKKTVVFVDDVDPDRMNIINADGEVEPDIIRVPNADGTMTVKEGYYVDPNTGDWIGKDGKTSSREATKDRYIKKYAPTKVKIQSGTKASENTNKQKPVVHEGYSRKDLLANGWTEDKIKKAVKAGKLKLND